jgi:hypothetical protein
MSKNKFKVGDECIRADGSYPKRRYRVDEILESGSYYVTWQHGAVRRNTLHLKESFERFAVLAPPLNDEDTNAPQNPPARGPRL